MTANIESENKEKIFVKMTAAEQRLINAIKTGHLVQLEMIRDDIRIYRLLVKMQNYAAEWSATRATKLLTKGKRI